MECKDCKKEISKVSIRCKSCSNKLRKGEVRKKGYNLGKNNGMWKGDNVGYDALHDYIKSRKPKPELCEECKKEPPFDLANISGKYKRDLDDWEWLCRRCHMKKDGRLEKFKEGGIPWRWKRLSAQDVPLNVPAC